VFISPRLTDSEYAENGAIWELKRSRKETLPAPIFTPDLATSHSVANTSNGTFSGAAHFHLATSMRSSRAENLSRFVRALLNGEAKFGRELFSEFRAHYSIVHTRSIREARRWIALPPAAGDGMGRSRGLLIGAADQARGDLLLPALLPSLGGHQKTRPPTRTLIFIPPEWGSQGKP